VLLLTGRAKINTLSAGFEFDSEIILLCKDKIEKIVVETTVKPKYSLIGTTKIGRISAQRTEIATLTAKKTQIERVFNKLIKEYLKILKNIINILY
jgi:hypothetical protein